MPKHYKVEQNTEEWLELRRGKFTASTFKNLFSSETTATYKNTIYQVVFERLTGESPESFTNDYMERGHELEPFARQAYELASFNDVEDAGFFELNEFIGASPDGLVGSNGLIEIKSPAYNTMIEYLLKGELPSQYKWQVHGQLYVTEREWCDFMAYHPSLKNLIIRIHRHEPTIKELENKLKESIDKAETMIHKLKSLV
jgi:putative phage-type endonuclease